MSRTALASRGATVCSSSSPAWWPSESLISLNWSRSAISTAGGAPPRRARASVSASRSANSWRFGSPVSGSCSERWIASSSREARSIAEPMTLATTWMKAVSSVLQARGLRLNTATIPAGPSRPSTATPIALRMPEPSSCAEALTSLAVRSSTTSGPSVENTRPASERARMVQRSPWPRPGASPCTARLWSSGPSTSLMTQASAPSFSATTSASRSASSPTSAATSAIRPSSAAASL